MNIQFVDLQQQFCYLANDVVSTEQTWQKSWNFQKSWNSKSSKTHKTTKNPESGSDPRHTRPAPPDFSRRRCALLNRHPQALAVHPTIATSMPRRLCLPHLASLRPGQHPARPAAGNISARHQSRQVGRSHTAYFYEFWYFHEFWYFCKFWDLTFDFWFAIKK